MNISDRHSNLDLLFHMLFLSLLNGGILKSSLLKWRNLDAISLNTASILLLSQFLNAQFFLFFIFVNQPRYINMKNEIEESQQLILILHSISTHANRRCFKIPLNMIIPPEVWNTIIPLRTTLFLEHPYLNHAFLRSLFLPCLKSLCFCMIFIHKANKASH